MVRDFRCAGHRVGRATVLAIALGGNPTYASLDVERGTLAQVGVCAGNRGPHDVPVWLASEAGRRKVWLPCTPDILQLSNRIGTSIEVRSRLVDQIISAPLTDVWSGRIQLVNATDSLNISAGVLKPSVLRGLSFNCLAIALSCNCE